MGMCWYTAPGTGCPCEVIAGIMPPGPICIVTGMVAGCMPGAIMWLVVCCCTPGMIGTTVTPGGNDCMPWGTGWPCTRCITGVPICTGVFAPPSTGADADMLVGPWPFEGPDPSRGGAAGSDALTAGAAAADRTGGGRCKAAAAAAAAAEARAAAASCEDADTDRAC